MAVHVWKAGWHIACDECEEDSSGVSTIGYTTKAEAEQKAREHRTVHAEEPRIEAQGVPK